MSEETYAGDTLYYLVEGSAVVNGARMTAGDVLKVPGGTPHAVVPASAAKVLQLTLA